MGGDDQAQLLSSTAVSPMMSDDGFVAGPRVRLPARRDGSLRGLRFAAKDLYDVAGFVTGCGVPDWIRTHGPVQRTAALIECMLESGAELVGKTLTDELAFSLLGDNPHYGAPANPATPDRLTGGSSCGSAAAVAARLVDFALGTDTAGSIRIPSSNCGLLGFRPTHGLLDASGIVPLAPSFDTPGWMARDAAALVAVGRAVLDDRAQHRAKTVRIGIARCAFDRVGVGYREAMRSAAQAVARLASDRAAIVVEDDLPLVELRNCFRILQAHEAWTMHGQWISTHQPVLGADVRARFDFGRAQSEAAVNAARLERARHRIWINRLFDGIDVLLWPTTADAAPLRTSTTAARDAYRQEVLALTSLASMGGLPEVTLPVCMTEGARLGISIIARPQCDAQLLDVVAAIHGLPI